MGGGGGAGCWVQVLLLLPAADRKTVTVVNFRALLEKFHLWKVESAESSDHG